ncbi:carbonic anhydrase [Nostoc sp.]|uniref:carbonic anhydrase n=1 Tax=Nostoc sp. TaxID=1180 RepID=UPI002FF56CB6
MEIYKVREISRRNLLILLGAGTLSASLGSGLFSSEMVSAKESVASTASDKALKRLLEGNKRYVAGKLLNSERNPSRIHDLAKGQQPFAVVLACSDSRVPPEIVFDQGLGDLFTVRVAGNFLEPGGLASIDYAVEHLKSPLVLVLGHRRCGAVTAVVESIQTGKALPDDISKFSEAIAPAIESAKKQLGDAVDNAVRANIKYVTNELKTSQPVLAEFVKKGQVKVLGAYYNLDTGDVQVIA